MDDTKPKTSRDILTDIGATLTAERERQGVTLASVSQRLRILEEHLTYIEAGKLDNLPAMTYVIGYIRSYARLLELDDAKLCAELKTSLSITEDKLEYNFIKNNFDKKTGAGRVALTALVAGIFIYVGWYSLSVVSTTTATDVTQAVAPSQIEDVELKLQENAESIEPELVAIAPRIDTADQQFNLEETLSVVVEEASQQKAEAVEVEQDNSLKRDNNVISVESIQDVEEITKVTNAYAVNRSPDAEIVIEAIANSWVQVTRADGTPVTSRLMRLGDTYLIPSDEDLYLTTGNAGGLNIRMGSDNPFTLGSWGEALSELPLNKVIISERY